MFFLESPVVDGGDPLQPAPRRRVSVQPSGQPLPAAAGQGHSHQVRCQNGTPSGTSDFLSPHN